MTCCHVCDFCGGADRRFVTLADESLSVNHVCSSGKPAFQADAGEVLVVSVCQVLKFVCLFVCLLASLLACLLACLLVSFLFDFFWVLIGFVCFVFVCSARLFVCLSVCPSACMSVSLATLQRPASPVSPMKLAFLCVHFWLLFGESKASLGPPVSCARSWKLRFQRPHCSAGSGPPQ